VKATATRTAGFTHRSVAGGHELTIDEPEAVGGANEGPSPQALLAASLASCTAITMEMYAERKGWPLDGLEVSCELEMAQPGEATVFSLTLRMPADLEEEQVERLRAIAARCPIHRVLEGEVRFVEKLKPLDAGADQHGS
jgi:putative redox protein